MALTDADLVAMMSQAGVGPQGHIYYSGLPASETYLIYAPKVLY